MYENLIEAIKEVIRANGREEITGQLLQNALVAIIETLGRGYRVGGVAPESMNDNPPDYPSVWFFKPGNYDQIFEEPVRPGDLGVAAWDGQRWHPEIVSVLGDNSSFGGIVYSEHHFSPDAGRVFFIAMGGEGDEAEYYMDEEFVFGVPSNCFAFVVQNGESINATIIGEQWVTRNAHYVENNGDEYPPEETPGMLWYNTTQHLLKIYTRADGWVTILTE